MRRLLLFFNSTTICIKMKVVVGLVALVASAQAWSGAPKPSTRSAPTSTAKQAIAIPLEQAPTVPNVDDDNAWVANLDYEGFHKEVNDLGKELLAETGEADVEHLQKILRWRDISALVGIATMWMTPNPITVAALSTWTYASWTMVAHHTCHGGYNRVDAGKFNSRGFALGNVVKRIQDWCDWMAPEAWNVEHNRLHHYHLGEEKDPDLVQRNLEFLRDAEVPMYQKYATVATLMPIWKWSYYAPNTYKELQIQKWKKEKGDLPEDFIPTKAVTVSNILLPKDASERAAQQVINPLAFFSNVLGPFLFSRFILLPLPLLLIPGVGGTLFTHAIVNLLLADLLTNIHGFITIVTNHCGDDVYMFDDQVKPKSPSFYVRQIVGSANYKTGTDPIDFAHGWLNYQIEHHVWPDLSMLQYQRGAPKLKAICEKYGVPYVQESVWTRLRKTVDVMVGKSSMKRFPTELEPVADKAGEKGVTWKSTNGAIDDDYEEKN